MQQVIKDMAHLNSREKATIAHCLIASLDTEQDEETNQAWADRNEAIRRAGIWRY